MRVRMLMWCSGMSYESKNVAVVLVMEAGGWNVPSLGGDFFGMGGVVYGIAVQAFIIIIIIIIIFQ